MKKNTVIKTVSVQSRAERDAVARHQAALRAIEGWDRKRELRPHVPRLAAEAARGGCDWDAPVIQAMSAEAGPRTGTHPASMNEVVEKIRIKPAEWHGAPLFVDPPKIRLAERLAVTLCGMGLFLLGVAIGRWVA